MKKKISVLAVFFLAMTFLFGSTLCFAAETEPKSMDGQNIMVARAQNGSGTLSFKDTNTSIWFLVDFEWTWEEGNSSRFTRADYNSYAGINEQVVVTGFSANGLNTSNCTITIVYKFRGTTHTTSCTFHVDEYGNTY